MSTGAGQSVAGHVNRPAIPLLHIVTDLHPLVVPIHISSTSTVHYYLPCMSLNRLSGSALVSMIS